MLRLKYYSLTKAEKTKLKQDFYNTDFGKNIKNRLNRLLLIGIIGILFSIYLFISPTSKWDIVSGIILTIASITFIIASFKVKINKLNNYLTKKNK
ncbi:MAG: hypothetical protein E7161_05135 [Firmicutes bacterium]|nr:hypothetical protein [Bacillota bacterium]